MKGMERKPSETGTTSSVLHKHPFTTPTQPRNEFINVVTLVSVHNATLNEEYLHVCKDVTTSIHILALYM